MRDNQWLQNKLNEIWERHFFDIKKANEIVIVFGRKSKRRLGSIKLTPDKKSKITITGFFRDSSVPESVVEETIMHELVHYIHGFSSTIKRKFRHPHKGGIIKKEFAKRGALNIVVYSKRWLKNNWIEYIKE